MCRTRAHAFDMKLLVEVLVICAVHGSLAAVTKCGALFPTGSGFPSAQSCDTASDRCKEITAGLTVAENAGVLTLSADLVGVFTNEYGAGDIGEKCSEKC